MQMKYKSKINLDMKINGVEYKITRGDNVTDDANLMNLIESGLYEAITYDEKDYIKQLKEEAEALRSKKTK
ncbi:hypothetical protein NSS82_19070 [Paenibacillus sp. FSL H7-0735]|uniref:hypothetical protein n=1 Tax=Paenibacillus sp. FSL H7-0735 TaxID=2954736 RepID=UPI0030F5327D